MIKESKIWNFGIVGAGLIAKFHDKAIHDIPNARLIAICDIDFEKAKSFGKEYDCRTYPGYEQMYENKDVDIVTIATPSGLHLEPVIAAAQKRKHCICEKPLEITVERIDRMIAAHKESGTYLGCIFQNRFTDAMPHLRKAIKDGRFGKITYAGVYVPWWRSDEYYKNSWRGTWELDGGGALMNQSIHIIDMLCDLMPPVESVCGFTANIGHPQIETEDTAVAALKFANNALGVIYGTTSSFPGQFKRFEITGTQGTVVYLEDSFTMWQFAEERPEDENIRKQFAKPRGPGGVADPSAISHENHTRNFKAFLESIIKGTPLVLDGNEGRKAVELISRIYKASRKYL
jgi:UDP-N-acetyl-2-amino-2-deoxyglucuronate dehydrogenase